MKATKITGMKPVARRLTGRTGEMIKTPGTRTARRMRKCQRHKPGSCERPMPPAGGGSHKRQATKRAKVRALARASGLESAPMIADRLMSGRRTAHAAHVAKPDIGAVTLSALACLLVKTRCTNATRGHRQVKPIWRSTRGSCETGTTWHHPHHHHQRHPQKQRLRPQHLQRRQALHEVQRIHLPRRG